ncbi:MAG: hypothetical protein OXI33_08030 [Chloroflexota bacterium]|nr:hypothetical protein [Chloroflexota bacterium]
MSETVEQLRALTDEELVRRHDRHAQSTVVGTQHYLDELNRRYQERQTASMLRFTKWITFMTVVITIATLVNVVLAVGVLLKQ